MPIGSIQKIEQHGAHPSLLAGFFKPVVTAVMVGAAFIGLGSGVALAQTQDVVPVPAQVMRADAAAVDTAVARLMTFDLNDNGKIDGAGWGNEMGEADSLSRAIYDYINFVNPRGNYSFWGASSRGDYMVGGLGLGFSLRPKHMTGHNLLLDDDIAQGAQELKTALRKPLLNNSLPAQQVNELTAKTGLSHTALHDTLEGLLDHIVEQTNAKERRVNNSTALLTHQELIESLPAGSAERTIAETVLKSGNAEQFFERELRVIGQRREAFGLGPRAESGKVGDTAMHYLLVLAKQAQETHLVDQVRSLL